jgi:AcrR family transcriptional regulator
MARPVTKREDIEHGVVEVVARKGLGATTIQDIARAAEVSPGLLYRYWESRDDLAGDVYQKHWYALRDRLTAAAASQPEPMLSVRAMAEAFLRFADEQPVLLRFLLLSQHELNNRIPPEQSLRTLAAHVMRDAIRRGDVRALDPELAVQFLLGVVLQPVIGAVYGNVSRPVIQHLPAIVDAIERLLVPSERRAGNGRRRSPRPRADRKPSTQDPR